MRRILITGANGQIGSDLVRALCERDSTERLVCLDLSEAPSVNGQFQFVQGDVRDRELLDSLIAEHEIDTVFHLASLLSAKGEQKPDLTWAVNMEGLKHVLDIARERELKIFWPSSIAVFGPSTPREKTPQQTILEPTTMYGVTKVSGELLCQYYHGRYGVDVRSIRYPGIISHTTLPGGGTTDYAVEIFHEALENGHYSCFLRPETRLPMMYMDDAIRGTLELMDAPAEQINVRTSYNLAAVSFSAREIAEAIQERMPEFSFSFEPDERQQIADSWPAAIDDSAARSDWKWDHHYGLDEIVDTMLEALREKVAS